MARKNRAKAAKAAHHNSTDTRENSDSPTLEASTEHVPKTQKDAEELRLEKLVFGNDAGFQEALLELPSGDEDYSSAASDADGTQLDNGLSLDDEGNVGELDDADVSILPQAEGHLSFLSYSI